MAAGQVEELSAGQVEVARSGIRWDGDDASARLVVRRGGGELGASRRRWRDRVAGGEIALMPRGVSNGSVRS